MGVEALAISFLLRRAWLDTDRLCADGVDPIANGLVHELRAVVRMDKCGNSMQSEQGAQSIHDVYGGEFALAPDGQLFTAIFIENY